MWATTSKSYDWNLRNIVKYSNGRSDNRSRNAVTEVVGPTEMVHRSGLGTDAHRHIPISPRGVEYVERLRRISTILS